MTETNTRVGLERIKEMIPHRPPFLFLDEVINIVTNQSAVGVKTFTGREDFYAGHFPARPVTPGVLLIEAMAQTSAVLVVHTLGASAEGKLVYFMSIDECRFRKPVMPGDTVHFHVTKAQNRRNVWKFACEAKVGDALVAEAVIAAMILDE